MSADFPSGTFPATGHTPAPSVPAGPQVGDIVVYVGDVTGRSAAWRRRKDAGTEFIVTRSQSYGVQCTEVVRGDDDDWRDDNDWFFADPSSVRVVRRASYTEVQS